MRRRPRPRLLTPNARATIAKLIVTVAVVGLVCLLEYA